MPSFPTGDFRRLKCLVLLSIHAMLRVQMQIFSCHLRDPVPIPASSPVLHLLGCNGLCDYIRDTENNPRCPCIPHYQRHGGRYVTSTFTTCLTSALFPHLLFSSFTLCTQRKTTLVRVCTSLITTGSSTTQSPPVMLWSTALEA